MDLQIMESEELKELSPEVILEPLEVCNGIVWVAREDLLPGGTKQRALTPYLSKLILQGFNHFVYASPFCGFAQVALAVTAQSLGVKAVLFCELDPLTQMEHEFTTLARGMGAQIFLFSSLDEAEKCSEAYSLGVKECYKIPLGFCDVDYLNFMKEKLHEQLEKISKRLNRNLSTLWLPVGSGTLTTAFTSILPCACKLICVDVRVLPRNDQRLNILRENSRIDWIEADELFAERASLIPPVPSNIHYDSKLWKHVFNKALDGDIWWNVAR